MASANEQNLVKGNEAYASSFTQGDLALPPAKQYAIVTCMDARIDPASAFGITLGDAHVIRNAGASAVEAFRSLVISEQLLGTTEIFIIKHTGCGMLTFKDEDARGVVKKNLGDDAGREVDSLAFLPFADLDAAVRSDIQWLAGKKAIPESVKVTGWVYEVETGKVRKVE